MINSEIRRFVSIGLLALISTFGMTWGNDVFADQKSSPKVECDVDTDVTDHNKNTVVGPTDLQCSINSSNIRDSTIIQNPPSNGDFESLTVVSTDPSDGDNNVPTDLSEIKVTFNKKIDSNSVDTGSLFVFANNCGNVFCNDPNIQDVSVSGKSATFTIDNNDRLSPNTNYIASISSSIEDQDGNFLDCFDSGGVDDNCEWDFSTSGSSLSPTITLNPTSGPVGSTVTITGTGFAPDSTVTITFGSNTLGTVITTSNGGFSATFSVPLSTSSGDHTVTATEGSDSTSKTFTVTSTEVPAIVLNPTSGPVSTSVNITGAGFDPSSTVVITFNDTAITTTPATVTPTSNGGFSATFTVPSSSSGPQTVLATQGSKSASQTFTVTPILLPTSQSSSPNLSENMILPDIFA